MLVLHETSLRNAALTERRRPGQAEADDEEDGRT